MRIFVCKLHLHFPISKHLRGLVCHDIFGNLFRHSEIFGLHPPPPPPATIHASYGPGYRLADWNFSRSPANYVLSSYTSLQKALNQMLYLIAICIIKTQEQCMKLENSTLTIIKESKVWQKKNRTW